MLALIYWRQCIVSTSDSSSATRKNAAKTPYLNLNPNITKQQGSGNISSLSFLKWLPISKDANGHLARMYSPRSQYYEAQNSNNQNQRPIVDNQGSLYNPTETNELSGSSGVQDDPNQGPTSGPQEDSFLRSFQHEPVYQTFIQTDSHSTQWRIYSPFKSLFQYEWTEREIDD